ncbi:MAG: cupin domain-containing protein [Anaerolineales bacterium]|nr:MAG: cupin domain-containing protein [Anaerolineales bacterium]
MSDSELVFIENLDDENSHIPPDSILSRTILNNERMKVVLFSFAPGQELSEHTASMPAIMHILDGEAKLTLGGQEKTSTTGSWAYMPANLPHSVHAKTVVKMLLLLIKNS